MSVDFEQFIKRLTNRLRLPLPGAKAHEPLRARPTGTIRPTFAHETQPKPGSVLVLLYPEDGHIKFPLTQRAEYAGAHSGQISLPGGKAEMGESVEQTALREGEEEIGIHLAQVEVIGRLSEFFVIPSNFIVTPVVAFQRVKPLFTPDPIEVVRILEGTIEGLLREDAIQEKEIMAAQVYQLMAPHFLIDDQMVWGATAMMLNEFRMVLREIL